MVNVNIKVLGHKGLPIFHFIVNQFISTIFLNLISFINSFIIPIYVGVCRTMRDKILEKAMEWYAAQGEQPNLEDFIDLIIENTTDTFLEHLQGELEQEFNVGNLQHPFFISNEYYLELKLKDIKQKYLQNAKPKETEL